MKNDNRFGPHQFHIQAMSSAVEVVASAIARSGVVVFSKSYCPFCIRVKDLLQSLEIPAHVIELDIVSNGGAIQNELKRVSGHNTVPAVFASGKLIGGCDDVLALHKRGGLVSLASL